MFLKRLIKNERNQGAGANQNVFQTNQTDIQTMNPALQRKFARGINYNMKIIIRGDRNVGKTSLFNRIQGRKFEDGYVPTDEIQVASINWNYKTTDDIVKVEVWDVVDRGKRKRRADAGLKLSTEQNFADEQCLDAEFIDVYKGTHGVILVYDITKQWTFDYVERQLAQMPRHLPVLVLGNHKDMDEHRTVSEDRARAAVDHFVHPDAADRQPAGQQPAGQQPVHKLYYYAECSMKNAFGLRYLHRFLNLPFLILQRESLQKQLETNGWHLDSIQQELSLNVESDEQNYQLFLESMQKKSLSKPVRSDQVSSPTAGAAEPTPPLHQPTTTPPAAPRDASPTTAASTTSVSTTTSRQPARPLETRAKVDEFVPDEDPSTSAVIDSFLGSKPSSTGPLSHNDQPAAGGLDEDSDFDDQITTNPLVAGYQDELDSDDDLPPSKPATSPPATSPPATSPPADRQSSSSPIVDDKKKKDRLKMLRTISLSSDEEQVNNMADDKRSNEDDNSLVRSRNISSVGDNDDVAGADGSIGGSFSAVSVPSVEPSSPGVSANVAPTDEQIMSHFQDLSLLENQQFTKTPSAVSDYVDLDSQPKKKPKKAGQKKDREKKSKKRTPAAEDGAPTDDRTTAKRDKKKSKSSKRTSNVSTPAVGADADHTAAAAAAAAAANDSDDLEAFLNS